jgi:hypothetical protein
MKANLKYVQKIKPKPADLDLSALLTGRAIHGGMEHDANEKIRGRTAPLTEVLDAAVAVFEDESRKDGVPASPDSFAKMHETQLAKFEAQGDRARIRPYGGSVEAPFEIGLTCEGGPATLEGFVDLVSEDEDGSATVIDFKSSARAIQPREVEGHWQLALEQVGAGAAGRTLCNFVGSSRQKPTARLLPTVKGGDFPQRAIAWVVDVVGTWRKLLVAGVFPRCAPTSPLCNSRFCEFYCSHCYPNEAPSGLVTVVKPVGTMPAADWRDSLIGKAARKGGSRPYSWKSDV